MALVAPLESLHGLAASTLCVAARLGALVMVVPPLGGRAIPVTFRVVLLLAVSVLVAAASPPAPALLTAGVAGLIGALAGDVALGALMAVGVAFAFAAWSIGARTLDVQIGFGIGQVFDPATQRHLPIVSALFAQLAVLLFFLTDAHHLLLRGVAASLERFPIGHGWPLDAATPEAAVTVVLRQSAAAFSLGFALVAPVVLCLAVVDLGLGLLARNLPQMNLFVIGIPVKVVAGLALLAVWMPLAGGVVRRIHTTLFAGWDQLFLR